MEPGDVLFVVMVIPEFLGLVADEVAKLDVSEIFAGLERCMLPTFTNLPKTLK